MIDRQKITALIKSCSKGSKLGGGIQLHGAALKTGFASEIVISNDLIDMYGKCHRTDWARKVFDEMSDRNVVSWTALMVGFLQNGDAVKCLGLFMCMDSSGVRPNEFTLSATLKACGLLGILENGLQIHGVCAKTGYEQHSVVGNSIIFMYSKCNRTNEANQIFKRMPSRNLITWNAMIAGYAYWNNSNDAFKLFQEMQELGPRPDEFTFASLLKACSGLGLLCQGVQVHASIITCGISKSNNSILSGALIYFYVKCRKIFQARKVFEGTLQKNAISWTTLILGYAQDGFLKESMYLFREFLNSGISVDGHILSSVIGILADFALIEQGKQLHCYVIKHPSGLDVSVGNSLIDMYIKCGLTEEAELHFRQMDHRNVVTWTVMINGYGKHGNGHAAICLFKEMQAESVKPDEVTWLSVLSACSHAGLVEECREHFSTLLNDSQIKLNVEHYSCMVDLLGRAGRLQEANDLIKSMPLEPNIGIWQTLLSACRMHRDLEMGKEVGEIILGMDSSNPVNYVMISNIFADAGEWSKCQRLREMMRGKGLKKQGGRSWVEIDKEVHFFYGGDDSHPHISRIHEVLTKIEWRMKEELGYEPRLSFSLHDVEDESKEETLRVHSEKLAIGLWLVRRGSDMGEDEVIRIYKNLRVCGDCHEFIKGLSKVLKRILIVRDTNRFHKFEDGVCSCGDYW